MFYCLLGEFNAVVLQWCHNQNTQTTLWRVLIWQGLGFPDIFLRGRSVKWDKNRKRELPVLCLSEWHHASSTLRLETGDRSTQTVSSGLSGKSGKSVEKYNQKLRLVCCKQSRWPAECSLQSSCNQLERSPASALVSWKCARGAHKGIKAPKAHYLHRHDSNLSSKHKMASFVNAISSGITLTLTHSLTVCVVSDDAANCSPHCKFTHVPPPRAQHVQSRSFARLWESMHTWRIRFTLPECSQTFDGSWVI